MTHTITAQPVKINLASRVLSIIEGRVVVNISERISEGSLQSLIALCVNPERESTTITMKSADIATTLEMTSRFMFSLPSKLSCLLLILFQVVFDVRGAFGLKSLKKIKAVSVSTHRLI